MKVRISLKTALGDNAVSVEFLCKHFLHLATNVIHYVKETASNHRLIFQYPWNDDEMYLFRATVAYSLRQYYSQQNKTLNFT